MSARAGFNLVLGMWAVGVGFGCHSLPSDLTHQALYPFAVDRVPLSFQPVSLSLSDCPKKRDRRSSCDVV